MTRCEACDCWAICLITPDDHIDTNGVAREVIGCDSEKCIYGEPLEDTTDYWRLTAGGKPI